MAFPSGGSSHEDERPFVVFVEFVRFSHARRISHLLTNRRLFFYRLMYVRRIGAEKFLDERVLRIPFAVIIAV